MRKFLILLCLATLTFAGCGDDTDTATDDDTGADAAAGTSEEGSGGGDDTDFSGDGSGEFCDLARQYEEDFEDTGNASTAGEVKKEYEELTVAIDELSDEAPDEIKADVEVVDEAFTTYYETLEKYDFDFTKIPKAETEKLDLDSTEIESASNRVEAYFEKVCEIDSDGDGDTDGEIGDESGEEQAPDDTTATSEG